MSVFELREIGCKSVTVKEKDMVRVDLPDRCINSIVKVNQTCVLRVCWFIKRVISGDPCIIFIMFSELFPEPNSPILEVSVIPEGSIVGRII